MRPVTSNVVVSYHPQDLSGPRKNFSKRIVLEGPEVKTNHSPESFARYKRFFNQIHGPGNA